MNVVSANLLRGSPRGEEVWPQFIVRSDERPIDVRDIGRAGHIEGPRGVVVVAAILKQGSEGADLQQEIPGDAANAPRGSARCGTHLCPTDKQVSRTHAAPIAGRVGAAVER